MASARKEPRPGAWHGGLWLQASKRWNKMESSGVPVVFQTCETLVLLDRCPVHLSKIKRFIEMVWKQHESGTGEGVLTLVKLEKKSSIYKYLAISCFGESSPWLWLVILASIFWWWTWLYVSVADSLVSFQVSQTWFAIVLVHRPLPEHWKSTIRLRTSTCYSMKLAMKEQRPGAWHGGLWLQASKWWNKMEWSGVPVVFETCETFVLLVVLDMICCILSFTFRFNNSDNMKWITI